MSAYLITWTTYRTWLPGDDRRWVDRKESAIQQPDRAKRAQARQPLKGDVIALNDEQRRMVDQTTHDHCRHRDWILHAINVRSNHMHGVITADARPGAVMSQLKAWCSRRLNESQTQRQSRSSGARWWTRHGRTKWIDNEAYLANAIRYVKQRQWLHDNPSPRARG